MVEPGSIDAAGATIAPVPISPTPPWWVCLRPALVIALLMVCCSVCLAAALRVRGPGQFPDTLPEALRRGNATAPQIHVFLRSSCRSCRQHEAAMESALQHFADSLQDSMRSRIHLWELGRADSSEPHRTPVPLPWRSLGIRLTPTTWFVSTQDSIVRVWLGARSPGTWQAALGSLKTTDHGSAP